MDISETDVKVFSGIFVELITQRRKLALSKNSTVEYFTVHSVNKIHFQLNLYFQFFELVFKDCIKSPFLLIALTNEVFGKRYQGEVDDFGLA